MNIKKIGMILVIAFIITLGVSISSTDSDAVEDENIMSVSEGGCNYEIDLQSLSIEDPVAVLVGWDGETAELVIPSKLDVTVNLEGTEVSIECKIVMDGLFEENSVITSIVIEDGDSSNVTMSDKFVKKSWKRYGTFSNCSELTKVYIGNSVYDIGDYSFAQCSKLTDIQISEGVNSIGCESFYSCGIKEITIPSSIVVIEKSAFRSCKKLTTVTFSENSKINELGDEVFRDSKLLTEIELPDSISILNQGLLRDTAVTSINVPKSIKILGKGVFYKASKLSEVRLSEGLESFSGSDIFKYTKITVLNLPNSFNLNDEFDANLRYSTGIDLKEINIKPDNPNYVSIDGVVFNKEKTKLIAYPAGKSVEDKKYTVPEGVSVIGPWAFYKVCDTTSTVVLNEDVKEICDSAFYMGKLSTIDGASGVTTIGPSAFKYAKITDVSFNSVETIDELAFSSTPYLNDFTFPSSLKSIGHKAFMGSGLSNTVTIGTQDQCVAIDSFAFWYCNMLPELNLVNIEFIGEEGDYGSIANGMQLKKITYPAGFDLWSQSGPLQISKDGKTIYSCLQGYEGTLYIPASVNVLNAYDDDTIGFIFDKCNVTEVIFENDRSEPLHINVSYTTSGGQSLFNFCNNLETLIFCDDVYYLDNDMNKVFGLKSETISMCPSIKYLKLPANGVISKDVAKSGYGNSMLKGVKGPLNGTIWVGSGSNLHQLGFATSTNSQYSLYPITLPSDFQMRSEFIAKGDITVPAGVKLTNTIWGVNNGLCFYGYVPGADSVIKYDGGMLSIDGSEGDMGMVSEISRVKNIGINGFTNEGESVIVDLSTYAQGIPDGKILVQYSVYTEVDGELFLDPFNMVTVDVEGEPTVTAFVGERISSCNVTYCYEFAGKSYWTTVSESATMAPADNLIIQGDPGATLTIDDCHMYGGEFLAFGQYDVKIYVPDGTQYTLNGKPTEEIDTLVYYGQDLVFALVTQE